MRLLLRSMLLLLGLVAAAVPASARTGRPPAPPATSPAAPTMAALRAQANQAAARQATIQTAYDRLGDQVADVEGQLSNLEARVGPLRERVTRQAVALYEGDVAMAAVTHLEAAAAAMRSDRGAHLVAEMTSRDLPAIAALEHLTQGVRNRQSALTDRRREQERTLAELRGQREEISAQLSAMAAAGPSTPHTVAPRSSRSNTRQQFRGPLPDFVCPIDGPLAFSDDFGEPRSGGRRHMGNDLLNQRGTPNVAVVAGTIETRPWSGGGITVFLTGDDHNTYVYMHLLQIVGPVPRRVDQSEVIGLTGMTGDAQGYHTHFEFHPGGGNAVDPYPLVSAACH